MMCNLAKLLDSIIIIIFLDPQPLWLVVRDRSCGQLGSWCMIQYQGVHIHHHVRVHVVFILDILHLSPEIPLQTGPWRPGQRIPLSTQQPLSSSSMENPIRQVHSMLQELQGTMERVTEKLNSLENRITDIEGKHSQFEMLHATPPSSAPSTSPMEHNRNRRSPPELQVRFMQL